MKPFILGLLAVLFLNVNAAQGQTASSKTSADQAKKSEDTIQIDPIKKQDPIRVTLYGSCKYWDLGINTINRVRGFKETPSTAEDCDKLQPIISVSAIGTVNLWNSAGLYLSGTTISQLLTAKLMAALFTASKENPVVIEVNRDTLQVEKVIPTLDILSLSEEGLSPQG